MTSRHAGIAPTRLHTKQPAEIVLAGLLQHRFRKAETPLLIAIGGPGGSGKTTFSGKLQRHLPETGIVHLDNYKISRADRLQKQLNGPHPDANRMDLAIEHLAAIKAGETVSLPVYDLSTGDTGSFEEFIPGKFILVEGEIATYREFRHLIDCSLFIDSDFNTQLAARIGRDIRDRGHSLKKAVSNFLASNLTEFTEYGAESKQWSDVQLFCHDDYHFSIESVTPGFMEDFSATVNDAQRITPAGCIVPITTPFENDLSICQPAYIDHLAFLSSRGVTRLIAGGTTAEFFSLTVAERLTLLKLSREYFPGLILFNISDDSLPTALELAKRAARYGADGLLCLPPHYYANAPIGGMISWFRKIIDAVDLPFFFYNFPKHTGNPVTPELLAAIPHAGIKDSSATRSLIGATPAYLLGGDAGIVEAYREGACGYVPGLPNAFPDIYLQLETALAKQRFDDALALENRIAAFKKSLPNVSGIVVIKKYLNSLLGSYPTIVRPPLDEAAGKKIDCSVQLSV